MSLPKRIYFTGVPGSRWSGVAQIIESLPGMNISDRDPEREYTHHTYSGHKGVYYGDHADGSFFPRCPSTCEGYKNFDGTMLLKSHHWAYGLPAIAEECDRSDDWILGVFRSGNDYVKKNFDWWKQAGGFDITHPDYSWYQNDERMQKEINIQHNMLQAFIRAHDIDTHFFTPGWIEATFGNRYKGEWDGEKYIDIKVALYRP